MRTGGVGLVIADCLRGRPRPAGPEPRGPKLGQKCGERSGVTGLARGEGDHQRQATAIDQSVGLGGQAPTRTPDSVLAWFVLFVLAIAPILVIRLSPLCERSAAAQTLQR